MKNLIFVPIIALAVIGGAQAVVLPTAGNKATNAPAKAAENKTKWYIEGGLGFAAGGANSAFVAHDWCNSAGCVKGYWDTFNYPGSSQTKTLDTPTALFGALKFGRQYNEPFLFAWGAYGDLGNVSSALGIFAEFGRKWLFDVGLGVAHNTIFNKVAFDMRMSAGYAFDLADNLSLIPSVFFDFQLSNNGRAEGKGYNDEYGSPCYSCWAMGDEMLYYYAGGLKATIRYNF